MLFLDCFDLPANASHVTKKLSPLYAVQGIENTGTVSCLEILAEINPRNCLN